MAKSIAALSCSIMLYAALASCGPSPDRRTTVTLALPASSPQTDIIYADLTDIRNPLRHKRMDSTGVSIKIPKDRVTLIGFAGLVARGLRSAGLAASGIGGVARLGTQIDGLASLPLSASAEDKIDLGTLAASGSSYVSAVPATELADTLGEDQDVLRAFGLWDQCLMTVLNPDIDSDGLFDCDEDLSWQFRVDYFFNGLSPSDFSASTGRPGVLPSALSADPEYEVKFWTGFSNPPNGGGTPPAIRLDAYASGTGEPLDGQPTFISSFDPDYEDIEYYFGAERGKIPLNGDFVLSFDGDPRSFRFDSLSFVRPADDWETLLVPVHAFEQSGNTIRILSWKWARAQGNDWVDADPEEVKLRTRQLIFSLAFSGNTSWDIFADSQNPSIWVVQKKDSSNNSVISQQFLSGPSFFEDGTLDVAQFGIGTEGLTSYRIDYHDLADNVFAFTFAP